MEAITTGTWGLEVARILDLERAGRREDADAESRLAVERLAWRAGAYAREAHRDGLAYAEEALDRAEDAAGRAVDAAAWAVDRLAVDRLVKGW